MSYHWQAPSLSPPGSYLSIVQANAQAPSGYHPQSHGPSRHRDSDPGRATGSHGFAGRQSPSRHRDSDPGRATQADRPGLSLSATGSASASLSALRHGLLIMPQAQAASDGKVAVATAV